ncbi:MAG: ABC transporter substrate-binding protein [Pseudohongiellaceae bacterium]
MVTSIFLLAMALPIHAADSPLTVYAELEEAANFPGENSAPVPVGPAFDIVSAVIAEAGYQADVRVVPWARVIHSLESQDNVLAFSMTRTPDREDRFHWIGLLRPVAFKMWALPERAAEFPASLEDAKDLRVSAERGDVAEKYLLAKGFTNLIYLSQESNSLTMLRRDRIDLMIYIESGMPAYLARKNEPPGTLVPVYDLEEISTGHFMVMSKQSDPELVQLLRDSYQAVVDSGRFDHLIRPGRTESFSSGLVRDQ